MPLAVLDMETVLLEIMDVTMGVMLWGAVANMLGIFIMLIYRRGSVLNCEPQETKEKVGIEASASNYKTTSTPGPLTCPLCCEDKAITAMTTLSKCSHRSCRECIVKWIEKTEATGMETALPECPFCRLPINSEEAEILLGRPFQPQTANSAPVAAFDVIDELTLHWLQEQCKPCPRCGAYIEKIEGCDLMECLCGYRFCYSCGSPGARCDCTGMFHRFWDNVLDCGVGRAPVRHRHHQASVNEETGQMDLLGHITRRRQEAMEESRRQEEIHIRMRANLFGITWGEGCSTEKIKRKVAWEAIQIWAKKCGIAEDDRNAVWGWVNTTNHDGAWETTGWMQGMHDRLGASRQTPSFVQILFESNVDGKSPFDCAVEAGQPKMVEICLALGVMALGASAHCNYYYCRDSSWWNRPRTFFDWLRRSYSQVARMCAKDLLGVWRQMDQPTKNVLLVHKYTLAQIANICRAYLPNGYLPYLPNGYHSQFSCRRVNKRSSRAWKIEQLKRRAAVGQNAAPPTHQKKQNPKKSLPLLVLGDDAEDCYCSSLDHPHDSDDDYMGNNKIIFHAEGKLQAECFAMSIPADDYEDKEKEQLCPFPWSNQEFPSLVCQSNTRNIELKSATDAPIEDTHTMRYADAVKQVGPALNQSLKTCSYQEAQPKNGTKTAAESDEGWFDADFFVQLVKGTRGGKARLPFKGNQHTRGRRCVMIDGQKTPHRRLPDTEQSKTN